MRIKSIEYENFRNFKDRGKITCSTDGRVTIIYGKNGDGKTTLHQLLQWVFYGSVNFNKTTTDRLYNLKFESDCAPGTTFEVMGRVEFEHAGADYLLRRSQYYEKSMFDTHVVGFEFELKKKDDDNNWKDYPGKPEEFIEMLLPSDLTEYFFFDGESMIADLRVKGVDSAKKLKSALFSMFDLDVLDLAISHLGQTDKKTTAIGKLYLSKGDDIPGSELSIIKANIEKLQAFYDKLVEKEQAYKAEREEKNRMIREISEQIGSTKSRAEYERQRKSLQKHSEFLQKTIEGAQADFGDEVVASYPFLLISKAVRDAKAKIKLKVDSAKLPTGLGRPLIDYLLNEMTSVCICGNPLCAEEKERIRSFLALLPPKSFASLYHEFSQKADSWGSGYDRTRIEKFIRQVLDSTEQYENCEEQIRDIDNEQKKSADIESLVIARQAAEARVEELDQELIKIAVEIRKAKAGRKQEMDKFDKLTKGNQKAQEAQRRIDILEAAKANFVDRLALAADTYSQRLQTNIQELLNAMLTSKRQVSVSSDFAVRVFDSFEDESKSEGQFAIVSFAYIGGILKMLKSEEGLADKEYPLILDGPFSKLDPDQRQNVVDVIPNFAPQVILFSKDSLQEVFAPEQIGRIYTIASNDEKNIASVKEGYHWN